MNTDITILFGSQTGNSEDVAHRIAREAKKRHKSVYISTLDDYDVSCLPDEDHVVFVVATTGCGDPPDNMKHFWKFIWRSALPLDSLKKVKFAVLGLGDSSYQKFNIVAKKLYKRLAQLGAESVMPCCLGDDQHEMGYNAAVNPWLNDFWEQYLMEHPLPSGLSILPPNHLLPPKFKIKYVNQEDCLESNIDNPINSKLKTFEVPVLSNRRVTSADHWQDVRLVTLDITGSNIKYAPGDLCSVYPKNSEDSVLKFAELFQFNLDELFTLECTDTSIPTANPTGIHNGQQCNLRFLLENYLDICGSPKQYFWEVLAALSNGMEGESYEGSENDVNNHDESDLSMERDKLLEFLTPQGQDDLFTYCYRPRRTISEVLSDFPQTRLRLTLPYLLDVIPPMRPRAFSIASSQTMNPNELQILVAVVSYKTRLVEPRKGLCSNYLANLIPCKDKVRIKTDCGTLKFPRGNEPIIMVGPGTGCAPFRSFIDQRSSNSIGDCYLFFGCRNSEKDFFFQDEWKKKEEDNLLRVFPAFSRDQEEKVYVQHIIAKQGPLLCELLLQRNAYFILAGNSKNMPESVRDAIINVLSGDGRMAKQDSESYLIKMEKEGRYQTETWS